jgi:L-ribulose-5-phosphate 4-epimerase
MLLKEQRKKVIDIALAAQRLGLIVLTFGNISLRDRKSGYICITPSGMDYQELKPADVVVLNPDGAVVDGDRKASVEAPMHCQVYGKRQDIFGICHTHSVFATAWASCGKDIPVVVAELAALIGGPVKCVPYMPSGSAELAVSVAAALGNQDAVLLENHGVLAVGSSLNVALKNAVIVEEGAKIAYYAQGIGGAKVLPEAECNLLRKSFEKYGQKP